ncbi:MAG: hypothetical protein K2J62_06360, partial [Bacteroidales bacterium]|nr:hypothetical protein [Bacteroidales bacterium]
RMREIDYYSIINTAKRHALAEGEATGIRIGESQAKLEIARTLKARGMSDDEITEITGLSREDIAGI